MFNVYVGERVLLVIGLNVKINTPILLFYLKNHNRASYCVDIELGACFGTQENLTGITMQFQQTI